MIMNKSPFKVMTTAALATALAVPAVATTAPATVDAAETEVLSVAISLDGEVQVVSYDEFVNAIFDGEGDVYDLYSEGTITAVSVEEGQFVKYEALSNALFDAEEGTTTTEVLAELNTQEDALVDEDTVAEYEDFGDDEVTAPAIENVEPKNLKQISVNLSGDYQEADVTSADNYTVTKGDDELDLADVSLDGDTAVLTLVDAVSNQDELNVKVAAAVTGEVQTFEDIKFFDTTIPEVEDVEVAGSNVVKVNFSEPMNFGDLDSDNYVKSSNIRKAFQLNEGNSFVKDVKVLKHGTEANVYFYSTLDEGENTLTVGTALKDYAGFVTAQESHMFDVVKDEEAPELVDVKNVTPLKATLVFNEDVDSSTVSSSDFYHTSTSLTASSTKTPKVDGNEVTVYWDEEDALPNGTAYVYVKAESVKDLWGNTNDQQLRAVTEVELDETAPEVSDISSVGETGIIVTFNEEVNTNTATNEDNYTITNESGDEVGIYDITTYDAAKNQYEITFDSPETGGITVDVDGVNDIYGNQLDQSYDHYIGDSTLPEFAKFGGAVYNTTPTTNDSVQTLVVSFADKMATSGDYSVTDLSKYQVRGYVKKNGSWTSTPKYYTLSDFGGVNIDAIDNGKQVRITLDTEDAGLKVVGDYASTSPYGADEIKLAQVADAAGNKTEDLSGSFDLSDGDSSNINVLTKNSNDQLFVTGKNTVEIHLNDYVTEVDETEFDIYASNDGGSTQTKKFNITGKSLDNSGSHSVITFTVEDDMTTAAQYDNADTPTNLSDDLNVFVSTNTVTNTTNSFGEKVSLSQVQFGDDYAPMLLDNVHDSDNNGEYELGTRVQTGEARNLKLTFTENVAAGANADAFGTYLTVEGYDYVAGGSTSKAGEFAVSNISNNEVTLEVYVEENKDFEIDLTPNKFLTDGDDNQAEFQDTVTVDVYK